MKVPMVLIAGLPKKELVERIHFHQRQGEVSDRALGFYLLDMDKRKMYRPYQNAAEWARNHLPQPQRERPDKLILLARRLEKLPAIEAAFNSGEVPWTKIREIARIADENTEDLWLNASRRLTSRELEEEVRRRAGKPPEAASREAVEGARNAETVPEAASRRGGRSTRRRSFCRPKARPSTIPRSGSS
jgi:hypothetical protein